MLFGEAGNTRLELWTSHSTRLPCVERNGESGKKNDTNYTNHEKEEGQGKKPSFDTLARTQIRMWKDRSFICRPTKRIQRRPPIGTHTHTYILIYYSFSGYNLWNFPATFVWFITWPSLRVHSRIRRINPMFIRVGTASGRLALSLSHSLVWMWIYILHRFHISTYSRRRFATRRTEATHNCVEESREIWRMLANSFERDKTSWIDDGSE